MLVSSVPSIVSIVSQVSRTKFFHRLVVLRGGVVVAERGLVMRYISLGVSLTITLGVISYGLALRNASKPVEEEVSKKNMTQARMIADQEYAAYDGATVKGAVAVTAIRRYADKANFTIYLKKSNGVEGWVKPNNPTASTANSVNYSTLKQNLDNALGSGKRFSLADTKDPRSPYYMPTSSTYKAELLKVGTKVNGIVFVES